MSSTVNLCLTFSLRNLLSCIWAFLVLMMFLLSMLYLFYFKLRGGKKMLFFFLSQSTINPVDAVYQPSPLEQSVISTMPSQAVMPPGMVCRNNLSGNILEQSRMQLQSRCLGCRMVGGFCATHAVQMQVVVQRKGGEQMWSFFSP